MAIANNLDIFKQQRKQWLNGVDTLELQLDSLKVFMKELGYVIKVDPKTGTVHIHTEGKGEFMSFEDAVHLHDLSCFGYLAVSDRFLFPHQDLLKAAEVRIVEEVHLRRNKKVGIEATSNFVKLCEEQVVEWGE